MRRIRFSDPEPDDQSALIDWRWTATIYATLFLNFSFCLKYGLILHFGPLGCEIGILAFAAVLLTAIFFIGPALAAQAARQQFFHLIDSSFGAIPALALRLSAVIYLSIWVADLIAVPALWALRNVPGRERPLQETILIAVAIVVFLFLTGLQSARTSTRLALFTDKLCLAVLIAAFIRVNDGWAAVVPDLLTAGQTPAAEKIAEGFSRLAFYAAPLLVLAAGSGSRCARRKDVALSGLAGLALPIFVALTFSVAIGVATYASRLYTPSLNPTVAMALFSGVARSAELSRMFIAAITTFGAARFGVRALLDSASVRPLGKAKWSFIACVGAVIAWLALGNRTDELTKISDLSATSLVIAGAVVTADFLLGRKPVERMRKIDFVAVLAFVAGMATPLYLPGPWGLSNWASPWLIPSAVAGFLVCLSGRAFTRSSRLE